MLVLLSMVAFAQSPSPLEERTFGIGVGTGFGTSELGLPVISRFGLRWQADERWAVDPSVRLFANGSQSDGPQLDVAGQGLAAFATLRYYAASKELVHLVALGGARVVANRTAIESLPTANSLEAGVFGGVGLEVIPKPWLGFGLDVTNDVVSFSRTWSEDTATTAWAAQVAVRPDVAAMVHLYY
jgi:hypothetical protein